MIKLIALILFSLPAFAQQPTGKELLYLEMLNYRLNMMATSDEIADTLKQILNEQRLIRCKIEPIENDCFEIQDSKNGKL